MGVNSTEAPETVDRPSARAQRPSGSDDEFRKIFEQLTGYPPMSWQERLFQILRYDPPANWPTQLDLPTGLGKTSVIHIWIIALAQQIADGRPTLPRRLVYVVDRRTVVDQATAVAERIKLTLEQDPSLLGPAFQNLGGLAVSTLRGQLADNREWSRDPSRPAIIIGTVDMIGSRLLFSGYRSSYKQRPLEAGLLGQDSLLILDEAHLSEPFEKLLRDIGSEGPFQREHGKPMRVVRMSATINKDGERAFQLSPSDLEGDKETNLIVRRYQAEKHLHIREDVADAKSVLADQAAKLAADKARVVVFVRYPEDAAKIAGKIREHGDKKDKRFKNAVAVLTGTMRGLERDEMLTKPENKSQHERGVMRRFLEPQNQPEDGPAILVSTSAGEVGFDLNADHLVCEAAPLDSIIQRLGRVNRRGDGCADVYLFVPVPKKPKNGGTDGKKSADTPQHTYETASLRATEILKQLPILPDGSLDASPKALATLEKPDGALAPKPVMVEMTDILLDAWSMTTIVEPMPGRPPVADWLRGIADDMPDTTIAWRAELDIPRFGDLEIGDVEEWFDAHRILPHETLTVPFTKAADWLTERWGKLDEKTRSDIGSHPCIIDRGGLRTVPLKDLVEQAVRKQFNNLINADIIVPASFGGIEREVGLLEDEAPAPEPDSAPQTMEKAADVADESAPGADGRHRLIRIGENEEPLCGPKPANADAFPKFVLDLPVDGDTVRQLVSVVPKAQRPESGSKEQPLCEHVAQVEKYAKEIADRLALEPVVSEALALAAAWHDHGKNRDRWQRLVGGKAAPSGQPWSKETLGKSGGKMLPDSSGYRHEFGSLQEFMASDQNLTPEVFDLAAHLIATHHGRSRPHFPKGGFDPKDRRKSPEIAIDAIRRFARLQRKYGYWRLAWLENLLRCADALASAEADQRGKP